MVVLKMSSPAAYHRAGRRPTVPRTLCPRGSDSAGVNKVLGGPKRSKLAHAFLWEYSRKRLELAQLLRQLGACLTWACIRRMLSRVGS